MSALQVSPKLLVGTWLLATVMAVAGTTVVAAATSAWGVSLEIDGTPIPVGAFAFWTLVASAGGLLLAFVIRDALRFTVVAGLLTAISLVPAVLLPDDGATKAVLVGTHLLAAVVVVPALARRL
jgi:hypothetical protein